MMLMQHGSNFESIANMSRLEMHAHESRMFTCFHVRAMSHDAEDEDDNDASKQRPEGDLLSQRRQLGICWSWTVSAENDIIHEGDVFFVCILSISGDRACGLDLFDSSVLRTVQPLPSDLCKFQALNRTAAFQLSNTTGGVSKAAPESVQGTPDNKRADTKRGWSTAKDVKFHVQFSDRRAGKVQLRNRLRPARTVASKSYLCK